MRDRLGFFFFLCVAVGGGVVVVVDVNPNIEVVTIRLLKQLYALQQ